MYILTSVFEASFTTSVSIKLMLLLNIQHQFLPKTDVDYQTTTSFLTKNRCRMYKLTSVLVKTDVDVKIYELF